MKFAWAAAIIAAGIAIAPTVASAGERLGDGLMGAGAGALVGGPVGAVAGGVIGYTAGPTISHGMGLHRHRHYHYRHYRSHRRTHQAVR